MWVAQNNKATCYSPQHTTDIADMANLSPMYKRLHQAIREVDDNHVIFFEPTIIITSVRENSSILVYDHYIVRYHLMALLILDSQKDQEDHCTMTG